MLLFMNQCSAMGLYIRVLANKQSQLKCYKTKCTEQSLGKAGEFQTKMKVARLKELYKITLAMFMFKNKPELGRSRLPPIIVTRLRKGTIWDEEKIHGRSK